MGSERTVGSRTMDSAACLYSAAHSLASPLLYRGAPYLIVEVMERITPSATDASSEARAEPRGWRGAIAGFAGAQVTERPVNPAERAVSAAEAAAACAARIAECRCAHVSS